jgi:hypothetical protein
MTLDEAITRHQELQARSEAADAIIESDAPVDAPEVRAAKREHLAIADEYIELFYALTSNWPADLRCAIRDACNETYPF